MTPLPPSSSLKSAPPLLHIIQGDTIIVLEEEVAGPGIEYGVTGRTLHLLGHLIAEILDHQLKKKNTYGRVCMEEYAFDPQLCMHIQWYE